MPDEPVSGDPPPEFFIDGPPAIRDLFLQQLAGQAKQEFSKPSIGPDDEGDLAFLVATDEKHGVVRLRFAKPVVWLAFEPDTARTFCNAIMEHVNELENLQNPPPQSDHGT
jgi:hypothetical protein